MTELVITIAIAVIFLGLTFYQAYEEKKKWSRHWDRKKPKRAPLADHNR